MTNEIVHRNQSAVHLPQEWEWNIMERYANSAVKSGLVKDGLRPDQAMFVILKGYELNITPIQALSDIHLINGKTGLSVTLMISLANRSGMLSRFDIPDAEEAFKEGRATVSGVRKDRPDSPMSMTFTKEDADRAGLIKRNGAVWNAYLGQMIVNRAVSMFLRKIVPEAFSGMLLDEELRDEIVSPPPSITISEAIRELPAPQTPIADGRPLYWNALIKKIGAQIPGDEDYRIMAAKAAELFRKGDIKPDMSADEAEDIIIQNCFTSEELLDDDASRAAAKEEIPF